MVLGRTEEAQEALRVYDRPDTVLQLMSWMIYQKFDPAPFPHLMAVLEREGVTRAPAVPVPFACTRPTGAAE